MTNYGGQALVEGVMMKGPTHITMAVRKPEGEISIKKERLKVLPKELGFLKWPFLRGIYNLFEMMVIGIRALSYSANESMGEGDEKLGFWEIFLSITLALAFAIILFKGLPLGIATLFSHLNGALANSILFNVIEGIFKVLIFLAYVYLIGLMPDIRRVFEYHGAEHKAVATHEHGEGLTVKNALKHSPLHPRCGTSFIMIVILLSILVYTLLPNNLSFFVNYGYRIATLPILAGISYEALKLSDRMKGNIILRVLTYPGILTQKLTTREPDARQMEVGLKALRELISIEARVKQA